MHLRPTDKRWGTLPGVFGLSVGGGQPRRDTGAGRAERCQAGIPLAGRKAGLHPGTGGRDAGRGQGTGTGKSPRGREAALLGDGGVVMPNERVVVNVDVSYIFRIWDVGIIDVIWKLVNRVG